MSPTNSPATAFRRALLRRGGRAAVALCGAIASHPGFAEPAPKAWPRGFADYRAAVRAAPIEGTRSLYVDAAAGRDSNDGSPGRPLRTISAAVRLARPGTVIRVLPGRYVEAVKLEEWGTASAWLRLVGDPPGSALIDGEHRLPEDNHAGLISIRGGSFMEISGLRLVNSNGAGVLVDRSNDITIRDVSTVNTWSSGVQAWRSSRVSIVANTVRLACQGRTPKGVGTQECVTLASCTQSEIAYNHVFDRLLDPGDGGEGIDCKQACREVSVHHNLVHHLHRLGIYIDAYDREESGIRVFANVVHDCSSGIVLSAERNTGRLVNVEVHANTVFDNRNHGIEISDYDHDGPREGIRIADNRVWRNGRAKWGGGISVLTRNLQTRDVRITSNVCYENSAWQICVATPVLSRVSVTDNAITGNRGYDGGTEREVTGENTRSGDFRHRLFDHAEGSQAASAGRLRQPQGGSPSGLGPGE